MSLYKQNLECLPNNDICFVVIGAMDGVTHDELFHYAKNNPNWIGVLVEPVSFYFEKLKLNYENRENLLFVNKAITDKKEIKTINRDRRIKNSICDTKWYTI